MVPNFSFQPSDRAPYSSPELVQPYEVSKVLLVDNPVSSRAGRADHLVDHLMDEGLIHPDNHIQTVDGWSHGWTSAHDEVLARLEPGTLLAFKGGDSLPHELVKILALAEDPLSKVPILGIGVPGNGNDHGRTTNSRHLRTHPHELLRVGSTISAVEVSPLLFDVTNDSDSWQELVAQHASAVTTGEITMGLDSLEQRQAKRDSDGNERSGIRQLIVDGRLILNGLRDIPTVKARRNEEQSEISNILWANGMGMSRFGRLPIKLADKVMFMSEIQGDNKFRIAAAVGRFVSGHLKGEYLKRDAVEFLEPTVVQLDGEPKAIPPSLVTVSIATKPFYVAAKNPNRILPD